MAGQTIQDYNVSGRITNRQGETLKGLIVRAYTESPKKSVNHLGNH